MSNKADFTRRMMRFLYCRVHNFLAYRLYYRKTLILYKHVRLEEIQADALIKPVDSTMLRDVLTFQPERFIEVFKQFLDNGDSGYFAYQDGRCVHRTWVQSGPRTINLHPYWPWTLEKNQRYIHYCETAPWARGKGIYPYVLSHIAHQFSSTQDVFICTYLDNPGSIKGILRAGFQEVERRRITGCFGFKRIKIKRIQNIETPLPMK